MYILIFDIVRTFKYGRRIEDMDFTTLSSEIGHIFHVPSQCKIVIQKQQENNYYDNATTPKNL